MAQKNDISDKRLLATRSHFSKIVMVWVAVSKLGKTSIFFVDQNVKIKANYYTNTPLERMLPEMRRLSNNYYYLFQQDGGRSHTARFTVEYLEQNVPELLSSVDWPANSPDLNALDYGVWENLAERVYR